MTAAALGVRFYAGDGTCFIPVGETLSQIAAIDASTLLPELSHVEILTMCDVDNPLYGDNGASKVFGPQKGVTPALAEQLDKGLRHLADVIQRDLGIFVGEFPGGGAAGGMGAGMKAFLGSDFKMGIQTILDLAGFDRLLQGASLVITGEGKVDGQSLRGKVVSGVSERALQQNVPVVVIAGDIGEHIESLYAHGVSAIFSINRVAMPYAQMRERSRTDLKDTVEDLMRLVALHL